MKKILFFLFLLAFAGNILSQDTLWLTNGKKIAVGDFRFIKNKDSIEFVQYKTFRNKSKAIESSDVFSITPQKGDEIIVYRQKDINDFNLLEMRALVQGRTDGLQFKSPLTTVSSVVSGAATVFFLNPIYVLTVSGTYCGGIGVSKPSKSKMVIPPEYINNQNYLLGYNQKVREKRIKCSIGGVLVGLSVGSIFWLVHSGGAMNSK